MARPKKYSPIKDIYLAGKIMGYALQLNTEALEKCLLETPDDAFKDELRMTLAYAIRIKNKTNNQPN